MTDKPTLILVPGLLCDTDLWTHQLDHLADVADCRVADVTGADSMDALAQGLLATAPDRFALAGLSMGGYVAQAVMRLAPGRVERIALLDTAARADTPEQTTRRRQLLEMSRIGRFRGVTDRLLPILIHEGRLADAALTARVKAMAERIGPEAFFRQQTAIMNRPDNRAGLARWNLPALVLCGREDALTPLALHEEMAGLIPGAKLAVVEECGHLSPMERPHAVTALLRQWLLYG